MNESYFHVTDGLTFARLEDGSVRIRKYVDARMQDIAWEHIVDEGSWRSVICSVSKYGEDSYRFFVAGAFHNGSDTIAGLDTMPGAGEVIRALAATERAHA